MTRGIERRIQALEATGPKALHWVWRREGETTEQAKVREGIRPDDRVLVFSWTDSEL